MRPEAHLQLAATTDGEKPALVVNHSACIVMTCHLHTLTPRGLLVSWLLTAQAPLARSTPPSLSANQLTLRWAHILLSDHGHITCLCEPWSHQMQTGVLMCIPAWAPGESDDRRAATGKAQHARQESPVLVGPGAPVPSGEPRAHGSWGSRLVSLFWVSAS